MKRINRRKGFTIVELVIVIAVIAIMAAVLIPTFTNVVEKARVSNDTAVCRNINTLLAMDEAENGKPDDNEAFDRLLSVAEEGGYILEKLTPMSTGDIIYDPAIYRIMLVSEDGKVIYSDGSSSYSGTITDEQAKSLYSICTNKNSTLSYTVLYTNVTDAASLTDAFTSSQAGVVVSENLSITSDTKLTADQINSIGGSSGSLSVVKASATATATSLSTVNIYIAAGKTFRITEGTTVTVDGSSTIVHDGTVLLYGSLSLTGTWYNNYYRTAAAANTDPKDFFIIKSTGSLSMPYAGAGGWRTVSAEAGAQINDGYFNWTYTEDGGWKVTQTITAATTVTNSDKMYTPEDTAKYLWKFIYTELDSGQVLGYWETKSVSGTDGWSASAKVPYGCNLYQTKESTTPTYIKN